MTRWRERATERLRDGEAIEETVPFGDNAVVVTSQRLLAFTPDGDGANYRAVERPNVEGASLTHVAETKWIEYILKGTVFGVAGVGIGLTVDFGGLLSIQQINTSSGGIGLGAILGLLNSINQFLAKLNQYILVGGLLALTVALGALGKYIESRTHVLAISVAGEDVLHVRAPKDVGHHLQRLQALLRGERDDATRPGGEPLDPSPE